MNLRFVGFGVVEIDGVRYDYDVVIDGGRIAKRKKKLSKPYRDRYGHTPLSAEEPLPWGGERLVVGTGADGQLPIMPSVYREAERRGVEVLAVPTEDACRLLSERADEKVFAVIHVTC
jgi:hypothetical protein